ncbi:MAG: anti-sigma factor antagonist [Lachnospiraceae bacterium]
MDEKYEMNQQILTVKVPRELDHHIADRMRGEIEEIMEQHPLERIQFDFTKTEFMDSSGIGVIIGRCRSMGFYGGTVELKNINERVRKIIKMSGLERIVTVSDN